jgi:hypothetical protein
MHGRLEICEPRDAQADGAAENDNDYCKRQ